MSSGIAAAQTASAPTAMPDMSQPIVMPRSNANASITSGNRLRGSVGGSNFPHRSTGSIGSAANSALQSLALSYVHPGECLRASQTSVPNPTLVGGELM